MSELTLEDLNAYRATLSNIKAIEEEIESLYNPVSSPNGKTSLGSASGSPGDPTSRTVYQIFALRERLEAERERLADKLSAIETWIAEIDDQEIQSIVRWHFINGRTWAETNHVVYGYRSEYAKRRFYRFFRKDDPVYPECTR